MYDFYTHLKLLCILLGILYFSGSEPLHNIRTIISIPVPAGFNRIFVKNGSFGGWLRNLPLKPSGSPVLNYRGNVYKKGDDSTVVAVVDWDIGGKRMEQCMDILIHFYAEFLWQENCSDIIRFPLPGGYWLDWDQWKEGWRPEFRGIQMKMQRIAKQDSSKESFASFLNTVFVESHTQQFYHAYKSIERYNINIGDFIVKKGSRGHAVMIMDLAENNNGDMVALIGHGDTPACQFYLLKYRKQESWFPLDFQNDSIPLPIRKKMTWDGLRRFCDMKY